MIIIYWVFLFVSNAAYQYNNVTGAVIPERLYLISGVVQGSVAVQSCKREKKK